MYVIDFEIHVWSIYKISILTLMFVNQFLYEVSFCDLHDCVKTTTFKAHDKIVP